MNETLKQLYARKSVRIFTDEAVTEEEKNTIIEAAFMAPTPGNQQMYTILNITDKTLAEKLSVLCDNQPFIKDAPFCLIFLADCLKYPRAYSFAGTEPRKPAAGDLLLAVADACIAAQNAVTAAESMGIGSCYIGDVLENVEEMRATLKLPKYVVPAAMLVFGRPTEKQKARIKPARFDKEAVVCENTYRERTEEEVRADFVKRAAKEGKDAFDYDEAITAFARRKYESAFSREMSRSALVYLKDFIEG